MLTREDNELLARTGPGTPMGELFRRFWWPIAMIGDLGDPDGDPIRIKLLGENLVAYRDTNNDVGVMDFYCPHRRAGMFFGRNEECGLRCVYHGWKFDKDGNCTDMPSEPAESNFKDKVKITAYPARDYADLLWVYMGPKELQPELPRFEWAELPAENRVTSMWLQDSNWMQSLEGDLDTSHISFNHKYFQAEAAPLSAQTPTRGLPLAWTDGAPRLTVQETDYGFIYGARRDAGEGEFYWRCTQVMWPMYSLIPSPVFPKGGHGWVPVDDEHNMVIQYAYNPERPFTPEEREARLNAPLGKTFQQFKLTDGYIVDCWRAERTIDNDYLIDREMQKTVNFTGIMNVREQDMAMTDTMGPIADRTKEHLGTSDTAIIAARRMLMKMVRDLQEGVEPHVPSHPASVNVRAIDIQSPEGDFKKLLEKHWDMTSVPQ